VLLTCRRLPAACKPLAKRVLPYYMVVFDAATDIMSWLWHGILLEVREWRRVRRRQSHDRRQTRQQVRSCAAPPSCSFPHSTGLEEEIISRLTTAGRLCAADQRCPLHEWRCLQPRRPQSSTCRPQQPQVPPTQEGRAAAAAGQPAHPEDTRLCIVRKRRQAIQQCARCKAKR
jgi:hypothetical protein